MRRLIENALALIGLVALIASIPFVLTLEKPAADITICEAGKCTQFNVRERKERR